MKILLFGKNGQVGRRLHPALLSLGEVIAYGSKEVDFMDANAIIATIAHCRPDIIINAAAYTAVDKAESDRAHAFAINYEAVKVIADEAKKLDAWFVHYSTDYVFDGTKNNAYTEEDKICPIGVYGESKAMADEYIASSCKKYLILRTSWVYDSYGTNFPKTILSLAQKNDSLRIIDDQIGSPTNAYLIANTTTLILHHLLTTKLNLSGLYNLSSSGSTSWRRFAKEILEEATKKDIALQCAANAIIPIKSSEYITAAKRPMNSRLGISKIENTFGLVMPRWDLYIPFFIKEYKSMGVI